MKLKTARATLFSFLNINQRKQYIVIDISQR